MRETGWRSVLTEEEGDALDKLETAQKLARDDLKFLSGKRRAIYLRAKKRMAREHKPVDKDAATP